MFGEGRPRSSTADVRGRPSPENSRKARFPTLPTSSGGSSKSLLGNNLKAARPLRRVGEDGGVHREALENIQYFNWLVDRQRYKLGLTVVDEATSPRVLGH